MSSAPTSPITRIDSPKQPSPLVITPPSSPPSDAMVDQACNPVSESMRLEEEKAQKMGSVKEIEERESAQEEWANAGKEKYSGQFKKLNFLVEKSTIYASIMQDRMKKQEQQSQKVDKTEKKRSVKKEAQAEEAAVTLQRRTTRAVAGLLEDEEASKAPAMKAPAKSTKLPMGNKKRDATNGSISTYFKKEDPEARSGGKSVTEAIEEAAEEHSANPTALGAQELRSANQPQAVTGGVMRSYQLEGLYWLASLYENGLNGILADEMGLGKTIQTIAFLAFLREKGTTGPFLVVAPLSTLSNWVDEFSKWTPSIPKLLYHGTPDEREALRDDQMENEKDENFPVICTSYEICMNDRKFLSQYNWKFIIIDEGHRLKNLNCRLIKELKQYRSANRLLITGTPLQNNLAELWSLLNFLMPEVFDTLDNFESFFDFSAVLEKDGHKEILSRERNSLVASLHAILKPFLLRRVKTDVETDLPKKREYILYAPLTAPQKEMYKQILEGNSRAYLEQKVVDRLVEKAKDSPRSSRSVSLKRKSENGLATPNKSSKSSRASTPASGIRSGRKGRKSQNYEEATDDELSDVEFLKKLNKHCESKVLDEDDDGDEEAFRAKTIALAKKEIAQKKLQNPIMQLRLACNSPHHFYWPWSADEPPDSTLITSSGKMLLLERLLPYLFAANHKVLIFSQFKTQLDILEDWATMLHDWQCCRIDGAVKQDDRRQMIHDFNTKDSCKLFLLSTRAGGQGINLAKADTVVLFDSDWNPQQDLQAQDRAHRIGQTRPVIVYRLATKGTVEQTLLEKADGKRRLEKLVVQKGKFKSLLNPHSKGSHAEEMAELVRLLEEDDFERYETAEGAEGILSDEDLSVLTDRSEAAYVRAERGLDGGERYRNVETKREGDGAGLLGEMGGG